MSYFGLAALVILTGLAAGLTTVLLHRVCQPEAFRRHHEIGYAAFLQLGVVFAVLLAFVFNGVWNEYGVASSAINAECSSLHGVAILAEHLPAPSRIAVQQDVRDYLSVVIEKEWPAMRHREGSADAVLRFETLWQVVTALPGGTSGRDQMLNLISQAHQSRETRLYQMTQGVPSVVWSMLIIFAVGLVSCMMVLAIEATVSKAVFAGAFAASLALALGTVRMLDFPFESALRLSSHDFNETLAKVDLLIRVGGVG